MARPRSTIPNYRKQKQTGRAVVSIYRRDGSRTEVILPGDFGSEQSRQEYERLLGKERAIFMPTGTLANHMAVRALAGGPSRVIVQEQSHFYQDEGDCA